MKRRLNTPLLLLTVTLLLACGRVEEPLSGSATMTMEAGLTRNPLMRPLLAGRTYRIQVGVSPDYGDGGIPADADGWLDTGPAGALLVGAVNLLALKTVSHVPFYAVTACYGNGYGRCFQVGRETRFTAEAGGGLNFFVNDARGMFFNNTGVATITITLAEQD